jgi:hypothetical protein
MARMKAVEVGVAKNATRPDVDKQLRRLCSTIRFKRRMESNDARRAHPRGSLAAQLRA